MANQATAAQAQATSAHPTIKRGSKGEAVKLAQTELAGRFFDPGPIDGIFGHKTEKAVRLYQLFREVDFDGGGAPSFPLKRDGVVGPKTWFRLDPPTVKKGSKGDAVKMLQELLTSSGYDPGSPDGSFGSKTENALKQMQTDYGLNADGIAGTETWRALGS